MLTSASNATARPAPTATPLTADTMGFSRFGAWLDDGASIAPLFDGGVVTLGHPFDHLEVPPALKARPAPVDDRDGYLVVGGRPSPTL